MTDGCQQGRLKGRVALITGASRGIGRGVALAFAREGADLILAARTQAALEEVDDHLRAAGHVATLVPGDLCDPALIEQMAEAVGRRWGRLDVLVGNAAELGSLTPLWDLDPATWDRVIALNLTANWRLIRAFHPLLMASDAGRAIFVSSGVASGRGYWAAYAVSKGALETLVRTYAQEVAKTSVRVNLIDPGATRTRMRAKAYPGEDPAALKAADDPRLMETFITLALPSCVVNGERLTIAHAGA